MERDFKDMLSALSDEKVEYLLVGAHAMAVHGCPRATQDIDFWIRPSPENAKRVFRALAVIGTPLQSVMAQDFEKPGTIFQIGLPPLRIDVITSRSSQMTPVPKFILHPPTATVEIRV
jgi:hypothetical protein